MNIKQRFPAEEDLKIAVTQRIDEFTVRVREEVGPFEAEYIRKSKLQKLGGVYITVGVGLLILPLHLFDADTLRPTGSFIYMLLGLMAVGPVCIYLGWRKMKGTRKAIMRFQQAFKATIAPLLFELFALPVNWIAHTVPEIGDKKSADMTKGELNVFLSTKLVPVLGKLLQSDEKAHVLSLLDHSELITESRNTMIVDDMFSVTIGDRSLFVSELDAKHVTGSGKNRNVKHIFTGYFVTFDLDTQLEGKTFVSTDGDKNGFGHQSFWKSLTNNAGVKETQLEWNEFESLLHVATTSPSEARYVLPPDFMHDLYEWWKEKKGNIRVSFIQSRMYILFPDKRIRFGRTVARITNKEVAEYLESVSLPLLHVLHLVEDVQEQFNHVR